MLGILVCTALSVGLTDECVQAKPLSLSKTGTEGKKNGQYATKKEKESEQIIAGQEGYSRIKEALEVSRYTYMITVLNHTVYKLWLGYGLECFL